MSSSLLVAHQDMVKPRILASSPIKESIIYRHNRSTGIPENRMNIFRIQGTHQYFSTSTNITNAHATPTSDIVFSHIVSVFIFQEVPPL